MSIRLIDIMPDTNAANMPARVDVSNLDGPFRSNSPIDAAKEAGMLIRNYNLKASSPLNRLNRNADVVRPDLDRPGMTDNP